MKTLTLSPPSEFRILGTLDRPEQARCERCGSCFTRLSRFIRICDGCQSNEQSTHQASELRACA